MTAADRRRVVVTGMGAVTAAGAGVERFWRACVEGRSALGPITRFDAGGFGITRAGEAAWLGPEGRASTASDDGAGPVGRERQRATLDSGRSGGPTYSTPVRGAEIARPCTEADDAASAAEPAAWFALEAAREAVEQAGLDSSSIPASSGVALGTCLGGAVVAFHRLGMPSVGETAPRPDPSPSSWTLSAPTVRLAGAYGLEGPVVTLSTACASGAAAIAHATDCIRRGETELMLAGGTDALTLFVVSGFAILRALTRDTVRPFDRRRDGLALGEGAGVVVLEERDRALRRGAPVLAEILGSGSAGDATHMTGPSPTGDGVVRAVLAALRDARVGAETVEFISAHGTATPFNDRMETIAFKRVFAERARSIPVNSIKPVIGHTLGAAGALEGIMCVKVLVKGIVPPTINYAEPDPECDLDYVPNVARGHRARCVLSCSSAFAGNNAALLLGAP